MAKQTFTTGQVLTAAQVNLLQSNDFNQTVSVKTASYTLVAADKGTRIEFNTSGSVTCTVNSGLFDAGDTLIIQNRGAGTVTVTAGTATVNSSATLDLAQYDGGTLYFTSASASIFFNTASSSSPLTTKGDLYTFGTADARLPVGSSGDSIVADSAATTGLRWQGNFAAGKNKIINGDFRINQRAFTSNTANLAFNFDRWNQENGGTSGTLTITPQTFTPGAAPVAGYEAVNFVRCVTASGANTNTYAIFKQKIEDVRVLAGETATISFWAKANTGTPAITAEMVQEFGTGGSGAVYTTAGKVTISTSWARYSVTVAIPSVSGKTIGTGSRLELNFWISAGSDYNARTSTLGLQNATFDFWGVQVESGSVATAFQTATGTLQGELALAQRYYFQTDALTGNDAGLAWFLGYDTGQAFGIAPITVSMRVAPTITIYNNAGTSGGANVLGSGDVTGVAVSRIFKNGFNRISKTTGWSANSQIVCWFKAEAEL